MIRVLFICHGRNCRFSKISLFYADSEKVREQFTTSLQLLKDVPI